MNYLISYPRSGNTVIRLFLERYARKPTSRCIMPWRIVYGKETPRVIIPEGIDYDDLATKRRSRNSDTSPLYPDRCDFLIWKTHGFYVRPRLEDRVVFLLRDYKDVMTSLLKYNKNTTNLIEPLENISDENYSKLEEYVMKELADNYIVVLKGYHQCKSHKILIRYEDLVRDGDEELKRILLFLNLDVHPRRLAACSPLNDKGRREIDEWFMKVNRKGKSYLSLGNEYIGRYKNYIRDSTIERMQDIVVSEMGELHELYTKVYDVSLCI